MQLKANVHFAFKRSTEMFDAIVASLKTEDDWFCQPVENANHALWIFGHLGLAANMFAERFQPGTSQQPEGWEELFWFGSTIKSDRSLYPSSDEVVAYFRERRQNLLDVMDSLSDDELNAAPPAGAAGILKGAPNVGHAFLFVIFHEGMHLGQLTVCHRGLGHPPLYAPRPASA